MARGRKAKPDNVVPLKQADGMTVQERNRENAARLKPTDLPEYAGAVWDDLAPHLDFLGRLKPHYVHTVSEYCRAISRMLELREVLNVKGETYVVEGRNGQQYKSRPEVAQLNETFRQWRSLTAMLGLSPADEKGLLAGQGELFEDDFAGF